MLVMLQVPPSVPAVIDGMFGVTIEERQMALVRGDAEGQPSGGVLYAEEDISQPIPGFGSAVPGEHDGRDELVPFAADDCASGLDDHHGPRVRRRNRADQFYVM